MRVPRILVWRDEVFRSAVMQMALDKAVFCFAAKLGVACARFYNWDRPAVTVGYFHRGDLPRPDAARRYTGGGVVEHGEDLTFVFADPTGGPFAAMRAPARYQWMHEAVAGALSEAGQEVFLAGRDVPGGLGPCFTQPVPWDLMDRKSGAKIGGGAQRRSRGAVIHQGSLRLPEAMRSAHSPWINALLQKWAYRYEEMEEDVRKSLEANAIGVV